MAATATKGEMLTPVTSLNANDVLLGRGSGSSRYRGNQIFRDVVKKHRQEYLSTNKHKDKNDIAKRVLDAVHTSGGRFLRTAEESELPERSVTEVTWYECDERTALEKCRQSLRQKGVGETKQSSVAAASLPSVDDDSVPSRLLNNSSPVPPISLANLKSSTIMDARLLLFQQQYGLLNTHLQSNVPSLLPPLVPPFPQSQAFLQLQQQGATQSSQAIPVLKGSSETNVQRDAEAPVVENHVRKKGVKDDTSDDDVSEYLMSVLALSGRSKFTDEQEEEEKANMTDEERARLLCDLFGNYCNVSHPSKKRKRDMGKEQISFLIKQMRKEIDKIPDTEKEALMEARLKCADRDFEFSEARLEQFLRCERMDVKSGARRVVEYWTCRAEVFGKDYLKRMTLSDALQGDTVALETGLFCLLPHKDLSGREILYLNPSRHTREGYTTASLLRSIWYVIEVAARANTDIESHAVQIVNFKNLTLWDFDPGIYDKMTFFETSAWPLRKCSFHACCPDSYAFRIIKPIVSAMKDKESRLRTIIHTVPESELMPALAEYGMLSSMLPTDIGGSLNFDQDQWIMERRSIEMEELN